MKPYVGQGSYINDVDPILAATPQWPSAYYGGNLRMYRDVKTRQAVRAPVVAHNYC